MFSWLPTGYFLPRPWPPDASGAPFMEDQAVEVIGQIGEREFRLRPGKADGADEQAIAVFLVCKDMFDPGLHR